MYKIIPLIAITMLLYTKTAKAQEYKKVHAIFETGDVVVSTTGRIFDGELDKSNSAYSELVVGVFAEKTEVRNVPSFIESGIAYVKFDNGNGSV